MVIMVHLTIQPVLKVEHIPEEIKKFIENKNIVTNIYRTEAYDLITCGYFCIDLMLFC